MEKTWHDKFISYAGFWRYSVWAEDQATLIGTYLFKWRAKKALEKYANKLYNE